MSVPNLKSVVQLVRDSQQWDFTTKEGLCRYSHAVVLALHRADPNFLHLKKRKPKNGCYKEGSNEGHAIDAALYVPTGQAVDFIGSAGVNQPNPVSWTLHGDGEYTSADGYAPVDEEPGPVDPVPTPDPLEPRVAALEAVVNNLLGVAESLSAVIGANAARMEAINTRFDSESRDLNVHKPLPNYYVSVFGMRIPVREA
jgi:hypothetical protein